jgi:hypothetical protein
VGLILHINYFLTLKKRNIVGIWYKFTGVFLAVSRELGWGLVVGWESIITINMKNNGKYGLSVSLSPSPQIFRYQTRFQE